MQLVLATLGGSGSTESEGYLELSYAFQGSFKGICVGVRNSLYRTDFSSDATFRNDNEPRIR